MSAALADIGIDVPRQLEVTKPRSWKSTIIYAVFTVVVLVGFFLFTSSGKYSTFTVAKPTDFFTIPEFSVPAKLTAGICGLICVVLTAVSFWNARNRRKNMVLIPMAFVLAFLFAFLTWAIADHRPLPLTDLISGALFYAIPLIFGALSGVIGERSGVVNIAIEGQLLAGAFISAMVASMAGTPWAGLVAAPLGGLFVAAILAWFSITYLVDQIIVGVVINVLVTGLTSYLFTAVMKTNEAFFNAPEPLPTWSIPVLSKIPVIGPMLFQQNVIVYVMYIIVIIAQVMLFRSKWGLRTRSVGEHPKAADTVGIKVNRLRTRNVLIAGCVAGLGGAFFTIGQNLAFTQEMTAGKGYIALAAMIFGRWSPFGAVGAAFLFGFSDRLQGAFQAAGVPFPGDFMRMLPYVVTLFAVAGLVGRFRGPAADGEPYIK